jgi:hypothetical protein
MSARAFAFVLVLLTSAVALACPVCGAETDTKGTYLGMTMVMSLLPLAMMGSVVGFIAFKVRKADRLAQLPPPPSK